MLIMIKKGILFVSFFQDNYNLKIGKERRLDN